jgi:hypothetical protein
MERVMDYAPPTFEVLGIGLLWMLKGTAFALALALLLAWNVVRVVLTMFFFGRLPRSYVRFID